MSGQPQTAMTPANSSRTVPSRFPVLEIFGPTVQGEGMVIGQKTMFVRTAGCDYACSWCDSAFTWDGTAKADIRLLEADDIYEELCETAGGEDRFSHVTLSGGNPALLAGLGEFISLLHSRGKRAALETQGSRWQDWFTEIDELTLSPKPPSSGMKTDWEMLDSIIHQLSAAGSAFSLKVVVFDVCDLDYAVQVQQRYPDVQLFIQAGNDRLDEADASVLLIHLAGRYEQLVSEVIERPSLNRARVLPQLHAWIWGNKRGV
ncbi:7-carboxy-7-deazaguanine synthase QueE [Paenibacillus sambharensis]|uniref:7-carboxy-7-deazaguanine synthase n=1 Tax=Paenibacillus sambharensis TaxID=1803190 RepID=A0A2W1LSK8_9BACL|nr:7-carboxy-7-deazaguanine synthase QueE [Paenibacillus sambharensis]PZD94427.1 7-carboxy-7-deazaguanine synthase QueE [Paenibacillus sambharensis]